METITIHKAKTQLSRLIEKACRGEEIIIARGKKPVVKLVAIADQREIESLAPGREKSKLGLNSLSPYLRKNSKAGSKSIVRCLLDTHTLIWWMTNDSHLSKSAHA